MSQDPLEYIEELEASPLKKTQYFASERVEVAEELTVPIVKEIGEPAVAVPVAMSGENALMEGADPSGQLVMNVPARETIGVTPNGVSNGIGNGSPFEIIETKAL